MEATLRKEYQYAFKPWGERSEPEAEHRLAAVLSSCNDGIADVRSNNLVLGVCDQSRVVAASSATAAIAKIIGCFMGNAPFDFDRLACSILISSNRDARG
jgi:hypothetical protein